MSAWNSYGACDAPVAPAVAARPLPGVVAVRALRVLFVAFPCDILPGNYAEKCAPCFETRAHYWQMRLKVLDLGLDY